MAGFGAAFDVAIGKNRSMTVADFNGVGNIDSIVELTQTRDFTYDDLQRLTAGGTVAVPESYSYDEEGNRTASHLSAAHTTDTANRLTEDDQFTYVYDANGNLTSKTDRVTLETTGYTYDAQDQLIRIDFPNLTFAEYRYDGLGRRIEKDVNGAVTRYVYDGEDILLEYDGTNFLLARYTHGPGIDDPVMLERDLDASGTFEVGERFFYQTDGLGSVTELTDSTGAVARTIVYDSYGQIAQDTGGIDQPFTYTGRELDTESGLYFYRARYYDPATGRFLTEDPIGLADSFNTYAYVDGDPVNFVDPTGEAKWVGSAVKIIGTSIKKLGQVTKEQAARRRRQGEDVRGNSQQQARQIEAKAHGTKDFQKHKGHVLEDGSIGRPHYQTRGKRGHTFWSIIGPIGAGLICAGEFIERVGAAAEDALIDFSLNPFDAKPAF